MTQHTAKCHDNRRRGLFVAGLLGIGLAIWSQLAPTPAAEARLGAGVHPVILPGLTYMGNASCAGSGCHGDDKATSQSGQNIGDESNIWAASDPHHVAFQTLKNDASKQMASKLKIADATASSRCLTCHATDAPKDQRGQLFSLEDAAGCESCHGPGQKYLNPHAEAGWTQKQRETIGPRGMLQQFGLADTNNLEIRANTCVACHLQIDKDMIDAGHPPLEFELYAYNYYISKKPEKVWAIHWDEPTGKLIDARLWATGQAAALEAAKAQVGAWKAKGWDTASAESLMKIYQGGVDVARKHFGGDTAAALAVAAVTPDKAAAAAKDLAKLAPGATNVIERRIVALGVAALGSATFDGRGQEASDAFWDAYAAAIDPDVVANGGDAYIAAVNTMAELAK